MAGAPDYDVAVVGYGPVGAVLALLLGSAGHRVVVLERQPAAYPLPRAVHLDHEVARILQGCGLGPELEATTEPAEVYEWRNAAGDTLLRFGRVGHGLSGWPESNMFHQPELERLLDRRVSAQPTVEVRRGHEVEDLVDTGDAVELAVRGPAGAPEVLRARYAVGCDGANSTVRGLLGTQVHDLGFFYDWLIVDLVLHEPRVFDPTNLQVCDPARPTTVVSGGPGRRRWEFMRLPGEPRDRMDEALAWQLLEPWGVTPAGATLERHAAYTFQARWAESWRAGHVFLAGDAAHQMPPFAGQGLCSGVRDAANLAWKLDAVLAGQAPDALLDTYGAERMPNARAVVELSIELGKVICVPDPAEAAARDDLLRSAVVEGVLTELPPLPGVEHGLVATGTPLAGQLSLQARVGSSGRVGRFDDLAGAGWRLVATPEVAAGVQGPARTWFEALGGRVVGVGPGGDVDDVDGAYAAWFSGHGVAAALQRPDHYLHGTAADAASAGALLDRLRAHLAEPSVVAAT